MNDGTPPPDLPARPPALPDPLRLWNALRPARGGPIGVHLDGRVVRLVQYPRASAGDRDPAARTASFEVPGDGGPGDAAVLGRMLREFPFRGRRAVGCVPADELVMLNVRVPWMADAELAGAVRFEIADRLPFPVAEAEVRHLAAGEVRRGGDRYREVVVLACRRAAADRTAALLRSAGLTPIALDAEPLAAFRGLFTAALAPTAAERRAGTAGAACPAGGDPRTGRRLVVHLGTRSTAVLLADGFRLMLAKTLPVGGATFDEAVTRHAGLSPAQAAATRAAVVRADRLDEADDLHRSVSEAIHAPLCDLADEIELCARHFQVTYRGERLRGAYAGGPECPPWLTAFLAERLALPFRSPEPPGLPAVVPCGRGGITGERASAWAAAAGLALPRRLPARLIAGVADAAAPPAAGTGRAAPGMASPAAGGVL